MNTTEIATVTISHNFHWSGKFLKINSTVVIASLISVIIIRMVLDHIYNTD